MLIRHHTSCAHFALRSFALVFSAVAWFALKNPINPAALALSNPTRSPAARRSLPKPDHRRLHSKRLQVLDQFDLLDFGEVGSVFVAGIRTSHGGGIDRKSVV